MAICQMGNDHHSLTYDNYKQWLLRLTTSKTTEKWKQNKMLQKTLGKLEWFN